MYKYQHKKCGGTGGICVLCPNLIFRWEREEGLKRREKQKRIKKRVDSTRIRRNSHVVHMRKFT